jgi:hypothetical protein
MPTGILPPDYSRKTDVSRMSGGEGKKKRRDRAEEDVYCLPWSVHVLLPSQDHDDVHVFSQWGLRDELKGYLAY